MQDQLCSYYSMQHRDHKWWHKILWHILDQSFLNTFTCYRAAMVLCGIKLMSHLTFNLSVAYALIEVSRAKQVCMPNAEVRNPGDIYYSMAWSGHAR